MPLSRFLNDAKFNEDLTKPFHKILENLLLTAFFLALNASASQISEALFFRIVLQFCHVIKEKQKRRNVSTTVRT